ncbi:hypothetical protein NQ315_009062 [Exocentrus adspersus]|uniref:THAP-type domain-containing protein n=1 Tax=Exocentrus adspersus TaxID=1586481 RepID=A0AAV8V954_9CUCU|nr:hypothetical protein NQ315_009062 [Exocentrus adspersus]
MNETSGGEICKLLKQSRRHHQAVKQKKQRYNTICCVYGCHSRKGKDRSIHFHAFPNKNSGIKVKIINAMDQEENIDKRKAWEKVLLMGKPVSKYMRVCSKHFTSEDYCAKDRRKNETTKIKKIHNSFAKFAEKKVAD